jgi:hypothetical protein
MNFMNLAPHLLPDEAVIGMALGYGAQLTIVRRFAENDFRVPADFL